jgi:hypothetical protein
MFPETPSSKTAAQPHSVVAKSTLKTPYRSHFGQERGVKYLSEPRSALVEETISTHQRGWVKFEGTYWYAEFCDQEIPVVALPGASVMVLARVANTLLVIPTEELLEVQFASPEDVEELARSPLSEEMAAELHSKTIYAVQDIQRMLNN